MSDVTSVDQLLAEDSFDGVTFSGLDHAVDLPRREHASAMRAFPGTTPRFSHRLVTSRCPADRGL